MINVTKIGLKYNTTKWWCSYNYVRKKLYMAVVEVKTGKTITQTRPKLVT